VCSPEADSIPSTGPPSAEFNKALKRSYIMFKLVSFQEYKDGSKYTNQYM
jgi:hypothetical protein